ncbi:MAG TPA: universal stress protein [Acidimicrobiia bacterium]|nr:universal stress protein [Acidimicrobiia bacterium]
MRILIATAGVLSPEGVARIVERLSGPDGEVVVMTVIEVPRSFLDEIRSDEWHPLTEGSPMWSSAEDAIIARYVEERGARLTEPLVSALAAYGVAADVEYVEGQDPATTILEAADRLGADVIVVGATKQLFDESQWESVSTRVISEARRPVLVVPTRGHAGNDDQ